MYFRISTKIFQLFLKLIPSPTIQIIAFCHGVGENRKMEKGKYCFPPLSLLNVTGVSVTIVGWSLHLPQNKLNHHVWLRQEAGILATPFLLSLCERWGEASFSPKVQSYTFSTARSSLPAPAEQSAGLRPTRRCNSLLCWFSKWARVHRGKGNLVLSEISIVCLLQNLHH